MFQKAVRIMQLQKHRSIQLPAQKQNRESAAEETQQVYISEGSSGAQAERQSSQTYRVDNAEGKTGGCSCIAGLGKSCSHAAAILWTVFMNPNIYFSLKATSLASLCSSLLDMARRAQGEDMFVEVVDVLHKKFLKKTFNFHELLWQSTMAHVVPELILKTI